MKYPSEINSIFFKKLILSGWYEEREVISDLPNHIKDLPTNVQNFLNEIWFINIIDSFFYKDEFYDIHSQLLIYSFGEITKKLVDYSNESDDYLLKYTSLVDCKIRNFGYKDGRELLIDEKGRIYEIPDSGDLIFVGAKFYEGLYNLIYDNTYSYLILDDFKLAKIENNRIIQTNLTLSDF